MNEIGEHVFQDHMPLGKRVLGLQRLLQIIQRFQYCGQAADDLDARAAKVVINNDVVQPFDKITGLHQHAEQQAIQGFAPCASGDCVAAGPMCAAMLGVETPAHIEIIHPTRDQIYTIGVKTKTSANHWMCKKAEHIR